MTRRALGLLLVACSRTPAPAALEILDGGTEVHADLRARDGDGPVSEADGRKLLTLSVADADVPVVGAYSQSGGTLVFRPASLVPGERYRATLHARAGDVTREITLAPLPSEPAPDVAWFSPRVSDLPENQLRFYVRFTRPMAPEVFAGIELRDDDAHATVPMAWREREIWSPDRMTLTLLLHPGRQKRDIGYGAGLGPVLVAGTHYSVVIRGLKDERGTPMTADFVQHFRATAADRTSPDPRRFVVRAPRSGTLEPVTVDFDEPMDPLVACDAIKLVGWNATPSPGADEKTIDLKPASPWPKGTYTIVVAASIEDLAGNTSVRLFDHAADAGSPSTKPIALPFSVK